MERFHAVGLRLSELWGMSESIIGSSAPPDRIRLGTAGYPFDGFEIRLGEDGEILVRSPSVTPGYFKEPERTREAISEDRWLHTGDLGRFDEDGYLSVVGRKKDIIINSAGKNMSPANVEQTVRGTDPLIGSVVCVGDGRPYNVGLIALDPQGASSFAAEHGIGPAPVAGLPGGDELTLTNKLKRAQVIEKYADQIDALYAATRTTPNRPTAGG
jgi:long-subunit acyl-CoA synthetase (AMP-forming)